MAKRPVSITHKPKAVGKARECSSAVGKPAKPCLSCGAKGSGRHPDTCQLFGKAERLKRRAGGIASALEPEDDSDEGHAAEGDMGEVILRTLDEDAIPVGIIVVGETDEKCLVTALIESSGVDNNCLFHSIYTGLRHAVPTAALGDRKVFVDKLRKTLHHKLMACVIHLGMAEAESTGVPIVSPVDEIQPSPGCYAASLTPGQKRLLEAHNNGRSEERSAFIENWRPEQRCYSLRQLSEYCMHASEPRSGVIPADLAMSLVGEAVEAYGASLVILDDSIHKHIYPVAEQPIRSFKKIFGDKRILMHRISSIAAGPTLTMHAMGVADDFGVLDRAGLVAQKKILDASPVVMIICHTARRHYECLVPLADPIEARLLGFDPYSPIAKPGIPIKPSSQNAGETEMGCPKTTRQASPGPDSAGKKGNSKGPQTVRTEAQTKRETAKRKQWEEQNAAREEQCRDRLEDMGLAEQGIHDVDPPLESKYIKAYEIGDATYESMLEAMRVGAKTLRSSTSPRAHAAVNELYCHYIPQFLQLLTLCPDEECTVRMWQLIRLFPALGYIIWKRRVNTVGALRDIYGRVDQGLPLEFALLEGGVDPKANTDFDLRVARAVSRDQCSSALRMIMDDSVHLDPSTALARAVTEEAPVCKDGRNLPPIATDLLQDILKLLKNAVDYSCGRSSLQEVSNPILKLIRVVGSQLYHAKLGKAAGPGGSTRELLGTSNAKDPVFVHIAAMAITGLYRLPDVVRSDMLAVRLVAIPKEDGTARPLGIAELCSWGLAKGVHVMSKEDMPKLLSEKQVGIGVASGCELVGQALRFATMGPSAVEKKLAVVSLDISNAFGTVRHEAILSACAGIANPILQAYLLAFIRPGSIVFDCGGVRHGCSRGVPQGNPMSPLLFAAATSPVLDELAKRFPLVIGLHDDTKGVVESSKVDDFVKTARDLYAARGCELNVTKTKVWFVAGVEAGHPYADRSVPFVRICGGTVGTPEGVVMAVGSWSETEVHFGKEILKLEKSVRALLTWVSKAMCRRVVFNARHLAWHIFTKCILSQVTHLRRFVPPDMAMNSFCRIDRVLSSACKAIMGLESGSAAGQDTLLGLPLHYGGAGIRFMRGDFANAAHASMLCATFGHCNKMGFIVDFPAVSVHCARVAGPVLPEMALPAAWYGIRQAVEFRDVFKALHDREHARFKAHAHDALRKKNERCFGREGAAFLRNLNAATPECHWPDREFVSICRARFSRTVFARGSRRACLNTRRNLDIKQFKGAAFESVYTSVCGQVVDDDGIHCLTCKKDGNVIARHGALVDSVAGLASHLGWRALKEVPLRHDGVVSHVDVAFEDAAEELICFEIKTIAALKAKNVEADLMAADELARRQHSVSSRIAGAPGRSVRDLDKRKAIIYPVAGTALGRLSPGTRATFTTLLAHKKCLSVEAACDIASAAVCKFTAECLVAAGAGLGDLDLCAVFDNHMLVSQPNLSNPTRAPSDLFAEPARCGVSEDAKEDKGGVLDEEGDIDDLMADMPASGDLRRLRDFLENSWALKW